MTGLQTHAWLSCRTLQLAAKPRLLVCAPSNAAADELLQRVMTGGFIGNDGNVYFPNVVRYCKYSHTLLLVNWHPQDANL